MNRANLSVLLGRRLLPTLIVLALLSLFMAGLKHAGYGVSYQSSPSMPEGWYWLLPIKHYERGEVVVFKPSQAVLQYLESHHWLASNRILMKKLYGLPGDEVCIRDSAVWVNGQKTVNVIADYAPGKALPQLQFCRQLQPGEYFLIGDRVANSFDSRYFGPVPQKAIIARAVPI